MVKYDSMYSFLTGYVFTIEKQPKLNPPKKPKPESTKFVIDINNVLLSPII